LNRSSNACRAEEGPAALGVLVCRSTVVRGENSVQLLISSFGEIRTVIFSVHSNGDPGSNDTHWIQLCTATPHREHRASAAGVNGN
jgi:hypothetical protein